MERFPHLVVIGGSMTGLLVARALNEAFERVTLIERDEFPAQPEVRRGVPQGHHLHVVLRRGQEYLDKLFPGISEDLERDGAIPFDYGRHARIHFYDQPLASFDSDLQVRACSRQLLDFHVHSRTVALPNIEVLSGHEVVGLLFDDTRRSIQGVQLHKRGEKEVYNLEATLVVDACGRQSNASRWLEELGFGCPQKTVIDASITYVCRTYIAPSDYRPEWTLLATMPRPEVPRSAGIYRIENNRWLVTLSAVEASPPTDEAGFKSFTQQLPSKAIARELALAEPVGKAISSNTTSNRLYHFERMRRLPDGLVMVGDSVCALNPVYGQGISSACIGVELLSQEIGRRRGRTLAGLPGPFHKRLAKANQATAMLAVGADVAWPNTKGIEQLGFAGKVLRGSVGRMLRSYGDLVTAAAVDRPSVARTMMEVMHLKRSSAATLSPSIIKELLAYRYAHGKRQIRQPMSDA